MPIYAPADTLQLLGPQANRCESRSLFQDRLANPEAKEDERKEWYRSLISKVVDSLAAKRSLDWIPSGAIILYARLSSRLALGLSDGVMENAHVTLDRYGLPVIPGSAIKGCARRMAIQALHDWIDAQENPGSEERPAEDDACAPCCASFTNPAEMLTAIARIFGYGEDEWKTGKTKAGLYTSDFTWAVHGHLDILTQAKDGLLHKTYAGTIAFLPAYPNADPGLELDVVTPHHTKYYQGELEVATDTEDPIPVYFPVVRAQKNNDHYTFTLYPNLRSNASDEIYAKLWLRHGLELFGLGAKTAAGYGWFDASEELNQEVTQWLEERRQTKEKKRQAEIEEAEKRREQEKQKEIKEKRAKALEGLTPEEAEDKKIELLSDEQFNAKIQNFHKPQKKGGPNEEEKVAIVKALRGSRIEHWNLFKSKAVKGPLAQAIQAIHQFNKNANRDKMP